MRIIKVGNKVEISRHGANCKITGIRINQTISNFPDDNMPEVNEISESLLDHSVIEFTHNNAQKWAWGSQIII